MTRRHLPVQHHTPQPMRPAQFYFDEAAQLELMRYGTLTPAQIVEQQQRNTELYYRWKYRQVEIKAKDAKVRRFWLSFGAVIGLAFLAVLTVGGWLLWHYLHLVGLGVLFLPVLLIGSTGIAWGGHRCITIVQHMH